MVVVLQEGAIAVSLATEIDAEFPGIWCTDTPREGWRDLAEMSRHTPHLEIAQLSLMARPSLAALQATMVISWPRADRRQSYYTSLPEHRATHPPAHRAWRCQHTTNSPSGSHSG